MFKSWRQVDDELKDDNVTAKYAKILGCPENHVHYWFRKEYEDRFYSNMFSDEKYETSDIIQKFVEKMEKMNDYEVLIAREIVEFSNNFRKKEDLWKIAKALLEVDIYFLTEEQQECSFAFEDVLLDMNIENTSEDEYRYLPNLFELGPNRLRGFVKKEIYDDYVKKEKLFMLNYSSVVTKYRRRFGDACGPFNVDKARESWEKHGKCEYWEINNKVDLSQLKKQDAAHETFRKEKKQFEEKRTEEENSGYSVYGYWFSDEGEIFSMQTFQDHAKWIIQKGFANREDAFKNGWSSMTMFKDDGAIAAKTANIQYSDKITEKGIKAIQKIVKRGGLFENVIMEEYDNGYNVVSYKEFDLIEIKEFNRFTNELIQSRKTLPPSIKI